MKFRYLGNSGLKVSEICYGNWLTHGSQVENETATKCVRAALECPPPIGFDLRQNRSHGAFRSKRTSCEHRTNCVRLCSDGRRLFRESNCRVGIMKQGAPCNESVGVETRGTRRR